MLVEGNQKPTQTLDYNKWLLDNVKGELDTVEAQVTLAKFLKHNPGFAANLLLGINLYPYQEIILRAWFARNFSMNVLARGAAKSTLASVFIPLWSVFNPGTQTCIVSSNFRTSRRILQGIESFCNNQKGALLAQCFKTPKLQKRPDQWEWEMTNGSKMFALPLSNENLRGIRADVLVLDEFLLIPQEVFEKVLMPFLVVQTDQEKIIRIRKREDILIAQGAMKEEDRVVFPSMKKLIILSSASYQFEYLYKTYKKWMARIMGEAYDKSKEEFEEALGNASYFISQMSFDILPTDLIDPSIINEAQNGGDENSNFKREYRAMFVDDSGAYFSGAKMLACTIPPKEMPCVELIGEKDFEYVLGIDPSRSSSKNSDHFAMSLLKLIPDKKKAVLVHSYAVAGGDASDHINYLAYLNTKFNISYIIIDNAGSEFIDYMNDSAIFKDLHLKLNFFEADFENPDLRMGLINVKNSYRKNTGTIVHKQYFSSAWIRRANEHLATCFEEKYQSILFASPLAVNSSFVTAKKIPIPILVDQAEEIHDFVALQDDLITLTKKECALIEVLTTAMGHQKFDIPTFLQRSKQADKARKDSYTSLLLAAWGAKCFYDMTDSSETEYINDFLPFAM